MLQMGTASVALNIIICICLAAYFLIPVEYFASFYSTANLNHLETSHHYNFTEDVEDLRRARHTHPACGCDRNFTRTRAGADPACSTPTYHSIISTIEMLDILENKTIAFLGDSVVRQEECNLRCLLRDFYVGSSWKTDGATECQRFYFQRNVSVCYASIGAPWHDPLAPRLGVDLLFADVDIIYWNMGNHYSEAGILRSALQAYDDVYLSLPEKVRPLNLFRLQSPPHFKTVDGHSKSTPLRLPFDGQSCEANSTFHQNKNSFRYYVGLAFAIKNDIDYLDISHVADMGCFHPGNGDCLHYDQDSWILSAINSAMLQRIQSLLLLNPPRMH